MPAVGVRGRRRHALGLQSLPELSQDPLGRPVEQQADGQCHEASVGRFPGSGALAPSRCYWSPSDSLGLLAAERKGPGDVIGYRGLIANTHGLDDEPELAFELLRRVWGQGYATEAALAVLGWAQASGYRRLWATVRDWNGASRGALAKLGFAETGRVDPDEVHGDSLFLARDL
ncbi:GNAT family N-acetyltransferase [Promicromonospora sp. NPDC023987]|uniref:GNAT family N-acetyltransferase n=1 Tax=Promicromonospora sp. NPDC023987 TaxID=3155360 RepID=UPI0033F89C39